MIPRFAGPPVIFIKIMDKNRLIQLTKGIYGLTLFFPKKEPLRYKIREVADEILVKPEEEDLELIDKYLEVAKEQNWVSPVNILAVQSEYANLRTELNNGNKKDNPGENLGATEVNPQSFLGRSANERQEKILEYLRENGRAQVWEINQILPDVTKRTLRRDFEHMLNQGTVERIGDRNNTFYQLKVLKS